MNGDTVGVKIFHQVRGLVRNMLTLVVMDRPWVELESDNTRICQSLGSGELSEY